MPVCSLLFHGGTPACDVSCGYFARLVDFGRSCVELFRKFLLLYCQRDLGLFNNIMVVTYCSKCHRLSLSLIAVNEITLMDKPYTLCRTLKTLPLRTSGVCDVLVLEHDLHVNILGEREGVRGKTNLLVCILEHCNEH